MSVKKIKSVIFDMDGVLVDARHWHYESLNRALGYFGLEISHYDHLTTFDGLPTSKKLETLSLTCNLPRQLHSFINKLKQKHTERIIYEHCNPIFQHEYVLSRLKKEGYTLALCSNSIRKTVDLFLRLSNTNPYISFSLSNQDVEKPKPDPEIYTTAIKKLGIQSQEALIIEDNINGIKAAQTSGAHLLTVNSPQEVTYSHIKQKINAIESHTQ